MTMVRNPPSFSSIFDPRYSDLGEVDEWLPFVFPKCTMIQSMRQPDAHTRQKIIITCMGSMVKTAHKRKLPRTVLLTNKKCRIFLPPIEVIVVHYAPAPKFRRGGGSLAHPLYTKDGTHRPICGNMYSKKIASSWITMKGIIPTKIWFKLTWGGATPFR
jgi:hypothetical protein